jgi:excisionase family DNA binding protein
MILMNPDCTTVFWRIGVGQILTAKELAKYLKLTEVTIYKYIKEGKIPGRRVGSRWRFDKDKIDELLKNEEKHGKE